jgi:hypothetical protein
MLVFHGDDKAPDLLLPVVFLDTLGEKYEMVWLHGPPAFMETRTRRARLPRGSEASWDAPVRT